MQKLKNKKRLTTAAIIFALTFLVGAAFAATPGALQTTGTVGLSDPNLHIIWASATPVANLTVAEVNSAVRTAATAFGAGTNQPASNHLANQRINWFIGFVDEGTVTLDAVIENVGSLPGIVYAPGFAPNPPFGAGNVGAIFWGDPNPVYSTDVLTVTTLAPQGGTGGSGAGWATSPPTTWPVRVLPGETINVRITVELLDHSIINSLSGAVQGFGLPPWMGGSSVFNAGEVLDGYLWLNSFGFSFGYTVAP